MTLKRVYLVKRNLYIYSVRNFRGLALKHVYLVKKNLYIYSVRNFQELTLIPFVSFNFWISIYLLWRFNQYYNRGRESKRGLPTWCLIPIEMKSFYCVRLVIIIIFSISNLPMCNTDSSKWPHAPFGFYQSYIIGHSLCFMLFFFWFLFFLLFIDTT